MRKNSKRPLNQVVDESFRILRCESFNERNEVTNERPTHVTWWQQTTFLQTQLHSHVIPLIYVSQKRKQHNITPYCDDQNQPEQISQLHEEFFPPFMYLISH